MILLMNNLDNSKKIIPFNELCPVNKILEEFLSQINIEQRENFVFTFQHNGIGKKNFKL